MIEKDMQNLIKLYPEDFLGEPLKLLQEEATFGSYRFDLLFEDRHGGHLIVELQRGTLDRTHHYKVLDYYDAYRRENSDKLVEVMVVANNIPSDRKESLCSRNIGFREIPESRFLEVARQKGISLLVPDPKPTNPSRGGRLKNTCAVGDHGRVIAQLPGFIFVEVCSDECGIYTPVPAIYVYKCRTDTVDIESDGITARFLKKPGGDVYPKNPVEFDTLKSYLPKSWSVKRREMDCAHWQWKQTA